MPDLEPIRLGPQGRLVIPARLRKQLGLQTGQVLAAHIDEGKLVLEPPGVAIGWMRAQVKAMGKDVDLLGDLRRLRAQDRAQELARDAETDRA